MFRTELLMIVQARQLWVGMTLMHCVFVVLQLKSMEICGLSVLMGVLLEVLAVLQMLAYYVDAWDVV
jgi:hypothetical protein